MFKFHEDYHNEFTKNSTCEGLGDDPRYLSKPVFAHPLYPVSNIKFDHDLTENALGYMKDIVDLLSKHDEGFDHLAHSIDSFQMPSLGTIEGTNHFMPAPILWGSEAIKCNPYPGSDELIEMIKSSNDVDYLICLDPFEYINFDYSEVDELESDLAKYKFKEVRCRGFNLYDETNKKNIDISTSRELYYFHFALTCIADHKLLKDSAEPLGEPIFYESSIVGSGLSCLVAKLTSLFLSKNLVKLRRNVKQIELLKKYCQSIYNVNDATINALVKMQMKIQERDGFVFRTPKLKNQSKESFFNDLVVKVFEHDDLHLVMAHKENPAYMSFQEEKSEVSCSKSMFFNDCDQETRVNAVLEEAYVIALERLVIPFLFLKGKFTTPLHAFEWAVWRICTNLTSGWFRQFACDNVEEIMSRFNPNYLDIFVEAYENKQIVELEKKNE